MIQPKIFIGPMSKNIVDSVIEFANENETTLGLIPSRRQIEHNDGYVNNWETKEFANYVKSKTDKVILVRDHGGPNQGNNEDDGTKSLNVDATIMDIVHVDVWKKYKDYNSGLEETISLINFMNKINPDLIFEVGTEEAIRPTTPDELDKLLTDLKNRLPDNVYNTVKYCVIQSGTALKGSENIGDYNQDRLIEMVKVVNKHKMISKEHNGDYLPKGLIHEKFKAGLECINIAPEFGGIETGVILSAIEDDELINEFYKICYDSKKWVKWVPSDYKPEENKIEIIKIAGHYVFSDPKFIKLKSRLSITDDEIKNVIKNRIKVLIDESKI